MLARERPLKSKTRGGDKIALGALALLTFLPFARYLLRWPAPLIYPESPLGTDLPREIWPLVHYVKQTLLTTGELPLWRPYLLSGAPVAGHPIAPLFYPPHWLLLPLPIALGLNLDLALHLLWMGVGTYAYLRLETETRWEAALFGATLFSLSPLWFAHISGGHVPMIAAISWWPWIWLGWNRYLSTAKARWITVAGIGFAAQVMNHGMFFALSLAGALALTVAKLVQGPKEALGRLIQGWVLSLGVGLSLSAIQLLPFLELLPHSTRASITPAEAGFGSLPLPLVLNAFFPPNLKFPEWYLYPGIGALVLALLSLTLGPSSRDRYALAASFGGLLLALGANTPAFSLLHALLPGFSMLRVPSRWWLFSSFALALLASWGLEKWLCHRPMGSKRLRLVLIGFGAGYGLIAGLTWLLPIPFPYDVLPAAMGLALLALVLLGSPARWKLLLIFAIAFAEIWWLSESLLRPQEAAPLHQRDPVVSSLEEAAGDGERSLAPFGGLEMAQLAAFDLRAAGGYDSFAMDAYSQLVTHASGCRLYAYSPTVPIMAGNPAASQNCPTFDPDGDILRALNVRSVLLPEDHPELPGRPLVANNGARLHRLPPGFGRAYGATEGVIASADDCPQILSEVDLPGQAVLTRELPFTPGGTPIEVPSSRRTANRETFSVEVTEPGLLVRSESWAPGWTASVDAAPAEVHRVNCALQGAWLEPGAKEVTFTYAPRGYVVGRTISLSAVGILLVLPLLHLYRRWREGSR